MNKITSYAQLNELLDAVAKTSEDFRRRYRIGDDKVFVLAVDLNQVINRTRRLRGQRTMIRRNGADVSTSPPVYQSVCSNQNEGLDISDLSPKEIMHLAEYRAIVDNWLKGELAELPPSNCAAPKADEE